MTELTTFLRWVITDAVGHGFWHFLAVSMIVGALAKFAAFVRVDVKTEKGASE